MVDTVGIFRSRCMQASQHMTGHNEPSLSIQQNPCMLQHTTYPKSSDKWQLTSANRFCPNKARACSTIICLCLEVFSSRRGSSCNWANTSCVDNARSTCTPCSVSTSALRNSVQRAGRSANFTSLLTPNVPASGEARNSAPHVAQHKQRVQAVYTEVLS